MVGPLLWEQEVAGSSPVTSTKWRIKHNWNCRGLENRSRESVWGFESLILRQKDTLTAILLWLINFCWYKILEGSNPSSLNEAINKCVL